MKLQPLFLALSCIVFTNIAVANVTEQEVRQAMGYLQQRLPLALDPRDQSTKLIGVSVQPGRMVIYQYAIDTDQMLRASAIKMGMTYQQLIDKSTQKFGSPLALLKATMTPYVRPGMVQQNCSMPFTHQMLQDGWTLVHQVDAIGGQNLAMEIVTLKDCGV